MYQIHRFYRDNPSQNSIIRTNLTLKQARAHTKSDKTHSMNGENVFFDGYEKMDKTPTGMSHTHPNYSAEQLIIQQYDDWLDSEGSIGLGIIDEYEISNIVKSVDPNRYWLGYDEFKASLEDSEENGEDRKLNGIKI